MFSSREEILKQTMHFHHMTITLQQKDPWSEGHEIYSFGRPFLGHHYYIHSLPDLCPGVDKTILKEKIYCHNMAFMSTPYHKNPCPGGN